jgi:hypothetical protein
MLVLPKAAVGATSILLGTALFKKAAAMAVRAGAGAKVWLEMWGVDGDNVSIGTFLTASSGG